MRYAADFETTTAAPAEVWAWACKLIGGKKIAHGTDLESFLVHCMHLKAPTVYFHNAKYDCSFIFYYLLSNGYRVIDNREEREPGTFRALISGSGELYSLELYLEHKGNLKKVTFWDSLKIFKMSIAELAECFQLKMKKHHIDYSRHNIKCEVSPEEWEYIDIDVNILAAALSKALDAGFEKMTIGSCALNDYKKTISAKRFDYLFPTLSIDADAEIRKSFKGAFVFLNPDCKNKDINQGLVLDTNGLYSYILATKPLPYGVPLKFEGQYKPNAEYPLFIQCFRCFFNLKPGKLPTVQQRYDPSFLRTEYLTSSYSKISDSYEYVDFCMTSPDLILFFEHYDVSCVQWLGGYMFKSCSTLFTEWIAKWDFIKEKADQEGNNSLRYLAKLIVNNLYGKFSQNPVLENRIPVLDERTDTVMFKPKEVPVLDENGDVKVDDNGEVVMTDKIIIDPVYIPVGTFITAYGRLHTIQAAQKMYDKGRFIYSDTDSLHLRFDDLPDIPIDPTKLGFWKIENKFEKARYLCPKRYILRLPEKKKHPRISASRAKELSSCSLSRKRFKYYDKSRLKIVCAGMPDRCKRYVTFKNFRFGAQYDGKFEPLAVPGGTILRPGKFTMSDIGYKKTRKK